MNKTVLEKYVDAKARIKALERTIDQIENRIDQMRQQGQIVADTVSRGKKGKTSLGTVRIKGVPLLEFQKELNRLRKRKELLKAEYEKLLELTDEVECFICKNKDIEIQNILTLYYLEDETWIQVARDMNQYYAKRNYTPDSCRKKHDRFLKKLKNDGFVR